MAHTQPLTELFPKRLFTCANFDHFSFNFFFVSLSLSSIPLPPKSTLVCLELCSVKGVVESRAFSCIVLDNPLLIGKSRPTSQRKSGDAEDY